MSRRLLVWCMGRVNRWRRGPACQSPPRDCAPPTDYDFQALRESTKPKFVIHGEADELFSVQDARQLYVDLKEPKRSS